jgi:short-subunit dehydrogenase
LSKDRLAPRSGDFALAWEKFVKFLNNSKAGDHIQMATALITGASSGIGKAFAQALAAQGKDLILVARSQGALAALAADLSQRCGVQAWAIAQDLTEPNAAVTVADQVAAVTDSIDLLINNAGYGIHGAFAEGDRAAQLGMVQLNVLALVDLTYQFLPGMMQRGTGAVLNIASTAAFQPMPYFAIYAATKAFVLSFSEALWVEGKDAGVQVLAVCPGPTETQFFKTAQFPDGLAQSTEQNYETPEAVVKAALEALAQGRANVVTGGLVNQTLVNASRFLPRELVVSGIGKIFKGE